MYLFKILQNGFFNFLLVFALIEEIICASSYYDYQKRIKFLYHIPTF